MEKPTFPDFGQSHCLPSDQLVIKAFFFFFNFPIPRKSMSLGDGVSPSLENRGPSFHAGALQHLLHSDCKQKSLEESNTYS